MVPLRSHEILELPDDALSGGARLTATDRSGLMSMLKGLAERPPIDAQTTSRSIAAEDEGTIIEVDPTSGTVTITLIAGIPIGFYSQLRQIATGTVRIVAGAGATVNAFGSPNPIDLGGTWAVASVEVRAVDTWIVTGQLA